MTARKMGAAISAVSDEAKFEMCEIISAVISMSTIPPDAWRDFLLAYAINEAHDQGVERGEIEGAAAEIIDEEWSTPNTAGRVARANARKNRRRN
jgi:hypothetical protein